MGKQTPVSLKALGRHALPERIDVDGRTYALGRVFKHDFFAATAMYEGDAGRVLLKMGRRASFLLVPLGWVGRMLAARERAAMRRLEGVDGIPRLIGSWGPAGVVREFVEGQPLARGARVGDDFFDRLSALISTIHERGMAYVDLEKPENVLVGDDGRPHLFDFQISWLLPRRWGGELWPARVVRGWLQQGDRYHVRKLQRRIRPDQMSPEQVEASYHRPWYLRMHGVFTRPLTLVRRRILSKVDPERKDGERGRVHHDQTIGARRT